MNENNEIFLDSISQTNSEIAYHAERELFTLSMQAVYEFNLPQPLPPFTTIYLLMKLSMICY